MNGLRIRICLVVLSNFHVQSIFIRVTGYFILIFKVLNHFLEYFFEELVTVGEAPTDFVLLTKEQLHMCYKGFLWPPGHASYPRS